MRIQLAEQLQDGDLVCFGDQSLGVENPDYINRWATIDKINYFLERRGYQYHCTLLFLRHGFCQGMSFTDMLQDFFIRDGVRHD